MTKPLKLADTGRLSGLRLALRRFSKETEAALASAHSEASQATAWLQDRCIHWQRESTLAVNALAQARIALVRCQRSGARDANGRYYPPNCGAEEAAVVRAEAKLTECQKNLETAQSWRSRVEAAVNEYQREARSLQNLTSSHSEKTCARLVQLEALYIAVKEAALRVGDASAGHAIFPRWSEAGSAGKLAQEAVPELSKQASGHQNLEQGERAERIALKIFRTMGFDRVGLGLHYGRHGLDVYGVRNTPHGITWARMEVKSTRDSALAPDYRSMMGRLKTDSNDLQQGSPLYGQDRLEKAFDRGSPVARFILGRQAQIGEGRLWQGRDYVCFINTTTGEYSVARAFSNSEGNRVDRLHGMGG